jgi:DNA-binding FrmR family transcriptional regulator
VNDDKKPSCCGAPAAAPLADGGGDAAPDAALALPRAAVRSPAERQRLAARLKRVEGQVAAIRRMLEADTYCVDVLVQISAARGALAKVGEEVLQRHVETCVADAFATGGAEARQEKIDELMDVFARYAGRGG